MRYVILGVIPTGSYLYGSGRTVSTLPLSEALLPALHFLFARIEFECHGRCCRGGFDPSLSMLPANGLGVKSASFFYFFFEARDASRNRVRKPAAIATL